MTLLALQKEVSMKEAYNKKYNATANAHTETSVK